MPFLWFSVWTELLPFLPAKILPFFQEHLVLLEANPDFMASSTPSSPNGGPSGDHPGLPPALALLSLGYDSALPKTLGRLAWVLPDLGAPHGTSGSQPPHSPTKGRCLGTARPDGAGE